MVKMSSVSVRRLLSAALVLAGLLLLAAPVWGQGGTNVDAQPITIAAGKDATVNIRTFCIEYGKPLPQSFPTLGNSQVDARVVQILRYAISRGYTESEPYQVQLAIWRQTTGEWKSNNRTRAEEIFNNAAQAPAAPAVSGTSLVQAAAANNIQVTATNWTALPAAPEQNPWAATGTLRLTNRGTTDLTLTLPTGILVDAQGQEQDTIMYVTSVQAQPTAAATAAIAAATSAPAATAAPAATVAATAAPAATAVATTAPAAAATTAPAAAATPSPATLPRSGGDAPGANWLMILGATLLTLGLALSFYRRATNRA